jgi:hypothetical protein
MVWIGFVSGKIVSVWGSYKHNSDSFSSIKDDKFLDSVRDYQLLRDQSVDKCTQRSSIE